jgi:hypothetical protein
MDDAIKDDAAKEMSSFTTPFLTCSGWVFAAHLGCVILCGSE